MIKYSFIIPVYNTEPYVEKCLNSILGQTYKEDFEVIIINDGSTDNSLKIISKFQEQKPDIIKIYTTENFGVSSARNFGIEKATGEYFLFVDSDDYISPYLLEIIDTYIADGIDVLSYNIELVDKNGNTINKYIKPNFICTDGEFAIKQFISKSNLFDTPVGYVYKRKYFLQNNFKYAENKYHEDFGLTPLVILKSRKITSINHILYFYVQSDNSIIRTNDYEKVVQKAYDMLFHFDNLYKFINTQKYNKNLKETFNSFLANSIVSKASSLNGKSKKEFIKELKRRKVFDMLITNTFKRKIKKIILKLKFM